MTDLVACLSSEKGARNHLDKVISETEWDNIFLITDKVEKNKFNSEKEVNFILIDDNKTISEITKDIRSQLYGKLRGTEVGINIVSGSGKEHMALLSAIMKLGLGFRLIAFTKEGVREI